MFSQNQGIWSVCKPPSAFNEICSSMIGYLGKPARNVAWPWPRLHHNKQIMFEQHDELGPEHVNRTSASFLDMTWSSLKGQEHITRLSWKVNNCGLPTYTNLFFTARLHWYTEILHSLCASFLTWDADGTFTSEMLFDRGKLTSAVILVTGRKLEASPMAVVAETGVWLAEEETLGRTSAEAVLAELNFSGTSARAWGDMSNYSWILKCCIWHLIKCVNILHIPSSSCPSRKLSNLKTLRVDPYYKSLCSAVHMRCRIKWNQSLPMSVTM